MDTTTEDVSARILLQHILQTEPPRTPVTRSSSIKKQELPRRSSRLVGKGAEAQSPQSILRRSMKNKLRESITRKSLPSTRRTASLAPRKSTPAPASMLLDDGDTPRHILRKILQTEPVRSPVFHKKVMAEEPQPPSADSSISSKRPSVELTTFDLPDLTIGVATSPVKGLSRKRPHRIIDVTAFEKRCQDRNDANTEVDDSQENSSLSILSSTSLSLKTPFVEAQTERRGLQRRVVCKRRKLTEEEFGHAVKERQTKMESFVVPGGNDTAFPEDFTLGLSKFIEPDITTDVVNCNTALYAQHDPSLLMVPTQDKPTVMASQLQRQIAEAEHEEDGHLCLLPPEETGLMSRNDLDAFKTEAAEKMEGTFDIPTSVRDDEAKSDEVEEPVVGSFLVETQEGAEMEEPVVGSQTEGDEDELQPEEESQATSLSEEEPATGSQSEGAGSPKEDDRESEGEQESQEDPSPDSQAEDEHDEAPGEEDEEQTAPCAGEHISRQAHRSEGGVSPVREAGGDLADDSETAGCPDSKYDTFDAHSSQNIESGRPSSGAPDEDDDEDESSAPEQPHLSPVEDNENSSHPLYDDTGLLSKDPAEEAAATEEAAAEEAAAEESAAEESAAEESAAEESAAEESVEEMEEGDDGEDDEEVPAFVREKIIFSQPYALASPSVPKTVQPSASTERDPAPKPKRARKRTGKMDDGLPKSYLMNVFKHFAKAKVSTDVYPVLKEIMDKYFQRLAEDLETYAAHAKRKTIEYEDCLLLLKRQGYVNDKVPVEVLIEKYLRMDQRRLLIPCATSGNVAMPKKR